jgi:hypothetical protein
MGGGMDQRQTDGPIDAAAIERRARAERDAALGAALRKLWRLAVARWPWLAWVAILIAAFAPYWHHFTDFWGAF